VDADGGDFGFANCRAGLDRTAEGGRFHMFWGCPHAGESGDAFGWNAKIGTAADEDFFELADIFDGTHGLALGIVRREFAQIEDGVPDELTGTVEGYVSAAVAIEALNAASSEQFVRCDYVRGFGVAAERDHRRVLEQQQGIADASFLSQVDQLLLQAKAGGVIERAELEN